MKLKIREKIIGIMVLLIIIPIVSLGLSSYSTSTKMAKNQYTELGTVIGEQAKLAIESKVEEANRVLMRLSTDPSLRDVSDENLNNIIDEFERTKASQEFLSVYFGTVDGKMIGPREDNFENTIPQERPWYIEAVDKDELIWSEVYPDAGSGKNTVTVSKAVYDGAGELKGVVGIDIDLTILSRTLSKVDIMGGHPIVMDHDGIIIVEKDEAWIGQPFQAKGDFNSDSDEVQLKEFTFKDDINNEITQELIVFSPVEGTDWYIATIIGMDALVNANKALTRNIIFVSVITIVIGIAIAIFFGRQIAKSINKILVAIKKMEQGDFTTRIDSKNSDEFGQVRDSFNIMMGTLCAFISNIKEASASVDEYSGNLAAISEEVSASSLEVARTAEEIAKGAANQADDTEVGVTLINQLSDKLVELDQTSSDMVNLADDIRKTSDDSSMVVDNLKEKTKLNNQSSMKVEKEIIELDQKISEVSEILSTIDAISEQTNLLALNASIEAARAGEYGKGFAVVAEEIRKLAGESKESSNNIKNIIDAVQLASKGTVDVVGEVNSRNEEQTEAVEQVSLSFETINDLIESITLKISDIDRESTEMNHSRVEIVGSIESISAISEETAAASEEVTASIEQQTAATEEVATSATRLNELANQLNNDISVFKI